MTDRFNEPQYATPLSPDDQNGLIPTWVTTKADLNVAERDNIAGGLGWAKRRRPKPMIIATDDFSRKLHKAMFGKVWRWAGTYRKTTLNIGVEPWLIAKGCAELFDTFRYWIEHQTYPPDELSVRFHHQIVAIHPFPNGNGRHSRLMGDMLVESLGGRPFTWGSGNLRDDGDALRKTYIATLKVADQNNISPLLGFARS